MYDFLFPVSFFRLEAFCPLLYAFCLRLPIGLFPHAIIRAIKRCFLIGEQERYLFRPSRVSEKQIFQNKCEKHHGKGFILVRVHMYVLKVAVVVWSLVWCCNIFIESSAQHFLFLVSQSVSESPYISFQS